MVRIVSLPENMRPIDKRLEITLKNGKFERMYFIYRGNCGGDIYGDIDPTSNEKNLLATKSLILLFRGWYYTKVGDVSSEDGDCVRTGLEYHVCGMR